MLTPVKFALQTFKLKRLEDTLTRELNLGFTNGRHSNHVWVCHAGWRLMERLELDPISSLEDCLEESLGALKDADQRNV